MEEFIVYVMVDNCGRVVSVQSSAFLADTSGWAEIDRGCGHKYCHAQTFYFSKPILTEHGLFRYELKDGAVIERSAEDLEAERIFRDAEMQETEARAERNRLLLETDWTQTMDAAVSAESRHEIRAYRQELRDITEQKGFPAEIKWPPAPEIVKADPDPVDEAFDILTGKGAT